MDFAGKTIVITGASDGIGKAAARVWAKDGARVVMIGRNEAKTAAAARSIMSEFPHATVTWFIAELSRREPVLELAARLRAQYPVIDVLANNAGALFLDREDTPDGIERTFALNHLAYVTLTLALLPSLRAAAREGTPARIVNVASRAHRRARISDNDWQVVHGFRGWRAYANSKLYNIWFTRRLAARLDPREVVVHCMHPGVVRTRFATNNGPMGRLQRRIMNLVSVTPEEGADTLVWLSHAPDALRSSGDYWVERRLTEPSRLARRDDLAEQLMTDSLPLTGLDTDTLRAWTEHAPTTR
ncbi:MAG: SDR family NAD(P)-dependent oxidoreductase [Gemmatimonadaceae bacterium]|nr:SDR family NAD(P)-dependent oxidoreductase [Gemmatimonadaceae bacterium]